MVFAIDDAYRLPLAVAWQSLRKSNPTIAPDLEITVLYDRLSRESMDWLHRHADRLGLRVAFRSVRLPELAYNLEFGGTVANYLRLAIPEAMGGVKRVLYLDADLIIRGDICPLLSVDLGGMPLGAVRDQTNPTYEVGRALPGWKALGIPGDREYFNSGVLVLDLPRCIGSELFAEAFRCVATHPEKLRLWDQDALNLAADDRWHRLPRKWNTFPFSALLRTPWIRYRAEHIVPVADLVAEEVDAVIMHYVSPSKPWKRLLPDGAANRLYREHWTDVLAAEDRPLPARPV